jgi:hypothetical protein
MKQQQRVDDSDKENIGVVLRPFGKKGLSERPALRDITNETVTDPFPASLKAAF